MIFIIFLPVAPSLAIACAGAECGQRGITPLCPVLCLFMVPVITASGLGDVELHSSLQSHTWAPWPGVLLVSLGCWVSLLPELLIMGYHAPHLALPEVSFPTELFGYVTRRVIFFTSFSKELTQETSG